MVTGERQASRIRSLYLKTILRQDVSFFDLETNTGEVVDRMSGDTVLIQDAMGEKVTTFSIKRSKKKRSMLKKSISSSFRLENVYSLYQHSLEAL